MQSLRDIVRLAPQSHLYVVLDAATLDGLLEPLYASGREHFACLLAGDLDAAMAHVAPYLVELAGDSPLTLWLEERLSQPWGYAVESPLPLRALHLHWRRFSRTRGPQGQPWIFRFWDPRVLRAMGSILTPAQVASFIQDVTAIHLFDCRGCEAATATWDAARNCLAFRTTATNTEDRLHHADI